MKHAAQFFATAREREAVRRRRTAGATRPWSADPIFNAWRFCNVRREDDKVTVWFRENVRAALPDTAESILVVLAFRWFNRIEVGERLVGPAGHFTDLLNGIWDRAAWRAAVADVTPVTNAAYMVNTPPGFKKLDGVLECIERARPLMLSLWQNWTKPMSLEQAWRTLRTVPRVGSFVAYEAVTDLRWTPVLADATDIDTWAAAGPGCAKGLGYVLDDNPLQFNYGSGRHQEVMLELMRELLALSRDPAYWPYADAPWEMHEVEMWACEYAKYRNAVSGRRLKRRYFEA